MTKLLLAIAAAIIIVAGYAYAKPLLPNGSKCDALVPCGASSGSSPPPPPVGGGFDFSKARNSFFLGYGGGL